MKVPALTALSYAAIITVYAAGYAQTREAADRFTDDIPVARQYQIQMPDGTSVAAARPFVAPPSIAPAPATPARTAETPPPARAPAVTALPPRAPEPESVIAAAPAPSGPPIAAPAPAPETAIVAAVPAPAPAPEAPIAAPAPAPVPVIAPAPAIAPSPAPTPAPAPAPSPQPPAPVVLKTGKYTAWGSCRHGDIEAEVQIARGMVVDVKITQCKVQYNCGDMYDLNESVLLHQGPSADYVAGSTQSTIAYYTAILNAIDKAK